MGFNDIIQDLCARAHPSWNAALTDVTTKMPFALACFRYHYKHNPMVRLAVKSQVKAMRAAVVQPFDDRMCEDVFFKRIHNLCVQFADMEGRVANTELHDASRGASEMVGNARDAVAALSALLQLARKTPGLEPAVEAAMLACAGRFTQRGCVVV